VGSVFLALADLITDGVSAGRIVRGDIVVSEDQKASYIGILCFGTVTTAVTVAYRLRNARLMRAQVLEASLQHRTVSTSEAQRQLKQHEWELVQTHRTKVISALALLGVATQGATAVRSFQLL
jgi:hypothetical protein